MKTRKHICSTELNASVERVFDLLCRPSAIRSWWCATAAIVDPRTGGTWIAAWGPEDEPDYITSATIKVFDPPRRIVFHDYKYFARSGSLPFEANFSTEFCVEAVGCQARLTVTQDGFPADPIADEFYAGCELGWRNTFEGIRKYVEHGADSGSGK